MGAISACAPHDVKGKNRHFVPKLDDFRKDDPRRGYGSSEATEGKFPIRRRSRQQLDDRSRSHSSITLLLAACVAFLIAS